MIRRGLSGLPLWAVVVLGLLLPVVLGLGTRWAFGDSAPQVVGLAIAFLLGFGVSHYYEADRRDRAVADQWMRQGHVAEGHTDPYGRCARCGTPPGSP